MGLIICEIHGEVGFNPHISKELSDQVLNNSFDTEVAFVEVFFFDEDDGEVMFELKYWMSKKCLESISALPLYKIFSDKDEENLDKIFNPIMKGGGCCAKCFEQFLIKSKKQL